ncbi:MAG: glycosyl hydrolase family 28-related protein [Steroidobacter sp.]
MTGKSCILLALFLSAASAFAGPSIFTTRPEDARAVYLTPTRFAVKADGVADDTAAVQAAIDRVQESTRRGIVFIPEGRYRLTKALQVWSGIRLIGYGARRPVFVLGENTPGYQDGPGKYLVHFVSDRPAGPTQAVRDANPGTFYSAMSNIDIEIRDGNPAAVGVRSHYAQHGFLSHMDFRIGAGRAGVEEVGNESSALHFFGGEFGVTMHKPSPSWPFVLLDSTFEGQRRAAIETEEGGLTLIRVQVRDVPTAVLVRPDRSEELYVEDSRFERISGPALVISDETNARTQINLRNTVCVDVPVFASFRESGRQIVGPGAIYRVKEFSHGLHIADLGATPELKTIWEHEVLTVAPTLAPTDIAALPPMQQWVNLRTLGAKGDGSADDTAVLRAAIAAHRVIYLPTGRYRVSDTITLRPDTVLIGLNPITTQILITDFTAAFQGVNGPTERPAARDIPASPRGGDIIPPFSGGGAPKALLEAPRGGRNIVNGLGLDTGGVNNRAVALKWMAGADSLVNDVRFLGGHGTYDSNGVYLRIYNDHRTADPDPQRRWDSQHWSLWVADGGGGAFKGLWTPNPFAAAGLYVSHTDTSGRVYAMSSEHHVRSEVKLRNVSNWRFYALQTEEERGESPQALPLDIENSSDILFANFFIYRVDMPAPFSTGIRVTNSRRLDFRGVHVYSPGKLSFDNTLVDQTHGREIRSREIAWLRVSGDKPAPRATAMSQALAADAKVEKLVGGFTNIDGMVADAAGAVYFVDQHWHRIHRWSAADGLTLVTDAIPQPVALALDRASNLLVVSRHGNVYATEPGASEINMRVLSPVTASRRPQATAWLPANRWRDSHDFLEASTRREPLHYVSPDGSAFIPAPKSYSLLSEPVLGRGFGTVDLTRAYALTPAIPGRSMYVSDEFGQTTWRFTPGADGTLGAPEFFAEEGEAGVAVDVDGNVYVCAGSIFVYDMNGRSLGVIDVPERPSALAFGDEDRRTLFIAARSSLYAVRTKASGR